MQNRPNRRIRTRMYGGVGGAERRRSPLSRSAGRFIVRVISGATKTEQLPSGVTRT